ncbi:DUF2742 domain-containing protein [Kribbella sp. NPDC049227]|uniref:DUF2742 domain-containing protein n=1 Tax=Kribbella sp. NPDC049227 TaxID=3364113 RepID=UPI00371CEDC5
MKVPRWTPTDAAAIRARRDWAKAMVARINDRPTYGTPRWAALADDDPRKLAAAVIAAECWATALDELPDRVRRDLDTLRTAHEAAEQADWDARFETARQIARSAATPAAFTLRAHYAKTQVDRIAEARRPRPADRPPAEQHRNAVQDGEAAA